MKNFEMAHTDDLEGIIKASQRSIVKMLKQVVADVRKDCPKTAGLSWEQIDYILQLAAEKEVEIIMQSEEM